MYKNIGGKIKFLAIPVFVLLTLQTTYIGVKSFFESKEFIQVIYSFSIIIIGRIVNWMLTWVLYGFGELIDKVTGIDKSSYNIEEILRCKDEEDPVFSERDEMGSIVSKK